MGKFSLFALILFSLGGCFAFGSDNPTGSAPSGPSGPNLTEAINALNFIHVLSGSGAQPGNIVRVQPVSWRPGVPEVAANVSTYSVQTAFLSETCDIPEGTYRPGQLTNAGTQEATNTLGGKAVVDARLYDIVSTSLGTDYARGSSAKLTDIAVEEYNREYLTAASLKIRQSKTCRDAIVGELLGAEPIRAVCLTRRALRATVEYTIGTASNVSAEVAAKISADIAGKLGGSVDAVRKNVITRPNSYIGIEVVDRCATKDFPKRIETINEPDPIEMVSTER
ncbi:MAG: hypothetical protein J0H44_06440 [Alphaproteobacteria bacterium]|nr:hypothetical protein [Alphaproteobacteria bacterium]